MICNEEKRSEILTDILSHPVGIIVGTMGFSQQKLDCLQIMNDEYQVVYNRSTYKPTVLGLQYGLSVENEIAIKIFNAMKIFFNECKAKTKQSWTKNELEIMVQEFDIDEIHFYRAINFLEQMKTLSVTFGMNLIPGKIHGLKGYGVEFMNDPDLLNKEFEYFNRSQKLMNPRNYLKMIEISVIILSLVAAIFSGWSLVITFLIISFETIKWIVENKKEK